MHNSGRRPRVNGNLLPSFINQNVCLVGSVVEVQPTSTSFKIKAADGKIITVNKREPIQDYLDGIVEIQGTVTSESSIMCNSIIVFPSAFDMTTYNDAITLAQKCTS